MQNFHSFKYSLLIKIIHHLITNILGTTSDNVPRLITKKWVEVHNQSGNDRYSPSKQIRFKTSMLRSDLCNFSDAYIVVKEVLLLQIQIMHIIKKN